MSQAALFPAIDATQIPVLSDGSPADGAAITVDKPIVNSAGVPQLTRAIWVGVTGAIEVKWANGNTCTFANVPVGYFSCICQMVVSAGTSASSLVAVF